MVPSLDFGGIEDFFRGELFSFSARGKILGYNTAKHNFL